MLALAMGIILCLNSMEVSAKIWRVNNRSGITADFTTAQAANDGATAGDSVFLEPSPTSYGNLTISKKIIVIGTGYFLTENPETQWKTNWPSSLENVTISSGGSYSQVMGVTINFGVTINAQNVTIKRNYVYPYLIINSSNVTITGNFIYMNYSSGGFNAGNGNHDIYISNNIFTCYTSYYYQPPTISGSVTSNGGFMNNVIIGAYSSYSYSQLYLSNYIVQNNILSSCTFSPSTNDYSYNIADNTSFGNLNGNQQNVNMTNVFLNTGSTDGRYQLKAGSPAIGAGFGGTDCGVFGGLNPYVLSGLPAVPAIYDFIIGNTGNQVNVQVKVKSHN